LDLEGPGLEDLDPDQVPEDPMDQDNMALEAQDLGVRVEQACMAQGLALHLTAERSHWT